MPPGGWRYRQTETGREWDKAASLDQITQDVTAHRMQNQLPVGDARSDIEHFTGFCLVDEGHADRVEIFEAVGRSIAQYWQGLKGLKAINRFQAEGRPLFVSEALATKRAAVCVSCPRNVTDTAENSVQRLSNGRMRDMVGGRSTPHDEQLKTCAVCSCQVGVIIHFTGELLQESGSLKNLAPYPPHCWKRFALPTP